MYNSTREFEACIHVNGKPVTEVVHNGQTFIEGRKKSNYELHFRNNSSQQVLVVPSVDGLSVIDGQRAGKTSPGFVIDPWGSVNIPGWTVNGREAAEFIFHAQDAHYNDEQTYVEEMDEDATNQGAIGFMVFQQVPHFSGPSFNPVKKAFHPKGGLLRGDVGRSVGGMVHGSHTGDATWNSGAESMNCSASASSTVDTFGNAANIGSVWTGVDVDEGKALGTGFGEAVEFETQKVEFHREANPCAVFAFFYDTLKNLRRLGVPVQQFNRHYSESTSNAPNPFPNSPEITGNYANAPRGWTGRHSSTGRRKTRS